jgi:hypothetical protein
MWRMMKGKMDENRTFLSPNKAQREELEQVVTIVEQFLEGPINKEVIQEFTE